MKKLSVSTLLVLLILSQVARARPPENVPLMGTIQFPPTLTALIEPIHITYQGMPAQVQVDQTNKNVTFLLPRDNTQFNFKLFIAEPQHIQPVVLSSKYLSEPTNNIAYQRIVEDQPYRYFMLTLVPTISKDSARTITYSWRIHEGRLSESDDAKQGKIPDDAIIMHMDPQWIDMVAAGPGFHSLTIRMKKNIIALAGSEQQFKNKLNAIAIAGLDKKHLEGEKQEAHQKKVGNTIIIAAPLKHTTA